MANASEIVVDTNVWVALLTGDSRADGLPEAMGGSHAVITPLVISELKALETQGRLRGDGSGYAIRNARVEQLTVDDALKAGQHHGAARIGKKSAVGLADALILATARRIGAPLLTLDERLATEQGAKKLG